jgi:membrane protein required for colicin V production
MEAINYFDIGVIAVVVIVAFKGFFTGVIKELFSIVGLVGGVYLASLYGMQVGEYVSANVYAFEGRSIHFIVGFLLFLILFWIVSMVIGSIFSVVMERSQRGLFSRIFGFILGGVKMFLLFAIFVFLLGRVDIVRKNFDNLLSTSVLYPTLIKTGELIVHIDTDTIKTENVEP